MVVIYPGTFSPPTIGHLHIIKKSLSIFPNLKVICSENPEKYNLFNSDKCKELWKYYNLPSNVEILTLEEFKKEMYSIKDIIMVRGLRDNEDAEYEKKIMITNYNDFKIEKFFYIFSDQKFKNISSSDVIKKIKKLEMDDLEIPPMIISSVLEEVLDIKNLFIVCGKPGSGKSTFIRELISSISENTIHYINTDEFNHKLKPLLKKKFGEKDLIKMAVCDEDKLKEVIKEPWMELLKKSLLKVKKDNETSRRKCSQRAYDHILVEIPFALQNDKLLFRYLGGKIIYVYCTISENYKRLGDRNTEELFPFVTSIPGFSKTNEICKKYKLQVRNIFLYDHSSFNYETEKFIAEVLDE